MAINPVRDYSIKCHPSDDEKTTFTEAIEDFFSDAIEKSTSNTVRNIGIISSALHGHRFYQGEELTPAKICQAINEIIVKNRLQLNLSVDPRMFFCFKFSELVDILKPKLQEELIHALKNNIKRQHYEPNIQTVSNNFPKQLQNVVYALSWALVEVASWPDRFTAQLAKLSVAYSIVPWSRPSESHSLLAIDQPQFLSSISKLFNEMVNSQIAEASAPYPEQKTSSSRAQNLMEVTPAAAASTPATASATESSSQPKNEPKPAKREKLNPAFQQAPIFLPNPDMRPAAVQAIANTMGVKVSISGGSGTMPQYSGQVNFILAGSKTLPNPHPNIAMPFGMMSNPDPTVGRGPRLDFSWAKKPVVIAINVYNSCVAQLAEKTACLNKLNGAYLPSDTPDETIAKTKELLAAQNEMQSAALAAMDAAWKVEELTNPHAVKKLGIPGDYPYARAFFAVRNREIRQKLGEVFGVPHNMEPKRDNLKLASILQRCSAVAEKAAKTIAEAELDKKIASQESQALAKKRALVEMQLSDAPLDQKKYTDAIQGLEQDVNSLHDSYRERGKIAPDEIKSKEQLFQEHLAALRRRELRFDKILAESQSCKVEDASADLEKERQKIATVNKLIDELVSQCPDQKERNSALLGLKNDLEARYSLTKAASQNSEVNSDFQEYLELKKKAQEMLKSDLPVQRVEYLDLLAKIQAAGSKLVAKLPKDATLQNIQNHIRDTFDTLLRRDDRYLQAFSNISLHASEEALLFNLLIQKKESQASREAASRLKQLTDLLARQIDELLTQVPEEVKKNSYLLAIKSHLQKSNELLAFCQKPLVEQLGELEHLRAQKLSENYESYATHLAWQLDAQRDYSTVGVVFQNYIDHLLSQDVISEGSVAQLSRLNKCVANGVMLNKIEAAPYVALLEAVVKKQPLAAAKISKDVATLYLKSNQSQSLQARHWYEMCEQKQSKPIWKRALALCYIQTLEYSEAERLILACYAEEPNNAGHKMAAETIVKDKYQTSSLLIEWLETGMASLSEATSLKSCQAGFKAAYEVMHIATHPAMLKEWLPSLLFLPKELKGVLQDLLSKDEKLQFTRLNIASLTTRAVPALTDAIGYFFPEENYKTLHRYTRLTCYASSALQQGISLGLTVSDLYNQYQENGSLMGLLSGTAFTVISPLNFVAAHLPPLVDAKEHPYLHATMETVKSKDFSRAITKSNLIWRSRNPAGRVFARLTGESPKYIEYAVAIGSLAYLIFSVGKKYLQEKDKITKQVSVPDLTAELSKLKL